MVRTKRSGLARGVVSVGSEDVRARRSQSRAMSREGWGWGWVLGGEVVVVLALAVRGRGEGEADADAGFRVNRYPRGVCDASHCKSAQGM